MPLSLREFNAKRPAPWMRTCAFVAAGLMPMTAIASAQEVTTKHPRARTLIVPASNHVDAVDVGKRAHTNLRIVIPETASPFEEPPYSGYAYETPASLACVYNLVKPIPNCNPDSTVNTPTGGSQTIAIVDAYDNPNAAGDLAYFSDQFGLPLKTSQFKVVYASGAQPAEDKTGGWELEEALDVEYAHAMAPNAKLYLVEADSNSDQDLFTAVTVATNLVRCGKTTTCPANATGKGEVSMSWGGSEFPGESSLDSFFTGTNVVYLAATGDAAGTIYPSTSPNVMAVGGTSNARSQWTGDLIAQIAWSDAGGGLSSYEPTPAFQKPIKSMTAGARAVPDVSAIANPTTGVWVYDSFPYNGEVGPSSWWIVGGTSVATPVWAGFLNNASTKAGHFAVSTTAELTKLYEDLNSKSYNSFFWDVNYGACGIYSGLFSGKGYDLCTGIGTPNGIWGK